MNRQPPFYFFGILAGLLVFMAPLSLAARQSSSEQPAQSSQWQSAGATASNLSPKEMQEERARIQMAEKRYDAAIQGYLDLLKSDPKNAGFMNMIGIAYLNLANYDQAKKYFLRAAKADKKNASAVNNLGMVYYHQKDFRRAIREYQRAISIDPGQAGAHANLGFAYYNSNKFPEAAAEFQKALEIDSTIFERSDRAGNTVQDRSVSNHGLFFFTMAKVYAAKGDAAHCAEYLSKSLDEGYKDIAKVATDPAFMSVIDDPKVQAVLARVLPAEQKGSTTSPGA
jgi:tetratricopeptide (TPR) repeat protein